MKRDPGIQQTVFMMSVENVAKPTATCDFVTGFRFAKLSWAARVVKKRRLRNSSLMSGGDRDLAVLSLAQDDCWQFSRLRRGRSGGSQLIHHAISHPSFLLFGFG